MNFVTMSGEQIDVANPVPQQIHLEDILHGLSHLTRYNGQTGDTWTVAQHTLAMLMYLDRIDAPYPTRRMALIHDFPEYVLGEVAAPVKALIAPPGSLYEYLTFRWEDAICERFGIGTGSNFRAVYKRDVQSVDKLIARSEMRLMETGHVVSHTDVNMDMVVSAVKYLKPRMVRAKLRQEAERYLSL